MVEGIEIFNALPSNLRAVVEGKWKILDTSSLIY